MIATEPRTDEWSSWLLNDRHGGDLTHELELRERVMRFADRVLDALSLRSDMTLLDVGTGDGLLALRAIERVGPGLRAVLTDISAPLLRRAQANASQRGVSQQCRFVEGTAEQLDGIDDVSIDAVGTRAVLAYVRDKPKALAEFMRVLKPGGRLSIAEPMLQDDALNAVALRRIVDANGSGPNLAVMRLLHKWKSAQFPDTTAALALNPLVNFSERDLFALVRDAGFQDIHLELHMDLRRAEGIPWATFLASSPHPWAPTLNKILAENFSPEERVAFEHLLRPAVESGVDDSVERQVFLTARKPMHVARCEVPVAR